jgi:hypothetical protein
MNVFGFNEIANYSAYPEFHQSPNPNESAPISTNLVVHSPMISLIPWD